MDTKNLKIGVKVLCKCRVSVCYNVVCEIVSPVISTTDNTLIGWYVKRQGSNATSGWFSLPELQRDFVAYDEDYAFFAAVGPGECVCKIPKKECKYHR